MFKKFLICYLVGLTLIFTAAEAKGTTTGPANNLQIVPQKIKEATRSYKIEMVYPKVKGMKEVNVQQAINRQIRKTIEENRSKFLKQKNKPFDHFLNTMSLRYEVAGLTPDYLSIKIKTEVMYAGAAHPQHWSEALNFDLKNGQKLSLPQIFKANSGFLKIIADYCAKELLSRPELSRDKAWVKKGTAPFLSNYKIFNLSPKALFITFPENQVGPYVAGEPVVEISFDKLRSIIKY